MKKNTHPEYKNIKVTCLCGNVMDLKSTSGNFNVELCYKCHPFYTGEQKIVDTANRVKSFTQKSEIAKKMKSEMLKKKEKKENKNENKNKKENNILTLRDMMNALEK